MTSAILYAYLRTLNPPSKAFSKKYIPLLNIPREGLQLRPEFHTLFQQCKIDSNNLVFQDDLKAAYGKNELVPENTLWVLVDHNKLDSSNAETYADRVGGCIDHHAEENFVPQDTEPEPRIIEECGSCTSLVLRELGRNLLTGNASQIYSTDVLKLGLASILVDTTNLQNRNKTRQTDVDVVAALDATLKKQVQGWDQDGFFEEINRAQHDIGGLELKHIFWKDYKEWNDGGLRLGMSSVVKPLTFLGKKSVDEAHNSVSETEAWNSATMKFMKSKNLDLWAIMTVYTTSEEKGNDFRRELALQWIKTGAEKVVEIFENKQSTQLKLVPKNVAGSGDWRSLEQSAGRKVWQQENLSASRKQVAPMLREAVKEHAGTGHRM
jgi:exopolyphosphatase